MIGMTLISYNPRPLIRRIKWWSVTFAAVAAIILLFAVRDAVGASHFGYPWFVSPICLVAIYLAVRLNRRTRADLRSMNR